MAARRVPADQPISAARANRAKQHLRDNVARNLLRLRTEADMSQRRLSERTGISQTYISQCEKFPGDRNLSLDLIAILALALDKTPADLISD